LLPWFETVTGLKGVCGAVHDRVLGGITTKYDSGREGRLHMTVCPAQGGDDASYIMPGYRDMSETARPARFRTGSARSWSYHQPPGAGGT